MRRKSIRERLAAAFLSVTILANQAGYGFLNVQAEDAPPSIQVENQTELSAGEPEELPVVEEEILAIDTPSSEGMPSAGPAETEYVQEPVQETEAPDEIEIGQEDTSQAEEGETEAVTDVQEVTEGAVAEEETETKDNKEVLYAEADHMHLEIAKPDRSLFQEGAFLSFLT